jgi:hypothetical protein
LRLLFEVQFSQLRPFFGVPFTSDGHTSHDARSGAA